ncbi:uncharacterized protein LOC122278430 [Carya illinoinensis]|uniref:Uncharacterized protein n=1 Tax=Carya illinoinensis TaxID=32201 RepID=A0A8T1PCF0_CARIL|nr:uncharacterized protein LOC122278430 [Carya illinoinensis]KAG6639331.1 hypothetical protein CIPAW_10G092000 [Carya illinoinensis]KAG6692013.1 hypothetical protein I3842_10G091200 [Carya illinoinensis]
MATQVTMSQGIQSCRDKAEIYHGADLCSQKARELLEGISLPKGLFPVDIEEMGHDPSSGFVWMKRKSKKEHKFKRINKVVSYDAEVTAFAEKGRLRKLTGVKSKEMLIWVAISDIYLDNASSDKLVFGVPSGLTRTYPASAFELEEDKADGQKNKN